MKADCHDDQRRRKRTVRQYRRKRLLWGYYFTNPTSEPLEQAAALLAIQGYRPVELYQPELDDPAAPPVWVLHVEKAEVHGVDSLHARNGELMAFAQENRLASYDGMDVGPVGAPAAPQL
ncbi:ribonuclease E inhibitor RraB [Janthinobacterium sp.]|uniref:ribonuclease E inhibitor RraB n=1 Tax=Janthinobacterium sp. TaxID=1871054 RepID=UPI0025847AE5|nr:ribonuclease E inhibitor RraB [Janthinobacterium sp.]MCX7294860.1 ribonuclease E inhibitor RraB [Janthinobacterium sp.]